MSGATAPTLSTATNPPGSNTPPPKSGFRLGESSRLIWPILALLSLLAFNYFFTEGFFHIERRADGRLVGSLIDVLKNGSPTMLLALGMTLVIATGGIDLSVGAVMAIAGATAACLIARPEDSPLSVINAHGSLFLLMGFALILALVCGIWNGMLVVLLDLQPIVATLILMVAGRGVAQLLTNGQIVTFHDERFAFLGRGTFLHLPFPVTIVAVMAIVTGVLSRGTALGLFIESVGNNPKASRLAGVPGRLVKLLAYSFCGVCAGIAGLIATADIQGADANNTGLYLELDAILAVSIGGTALTGGRFSLLGSLIGATLVQLLTTTILAKGVRPEVTLVVKGFVVIAVCLLQSPVFRGKVQAALRLGARRG